MNIYWVLLYLSERLDLFCYHMRQRYEITWLPYFRDRGSDGGFFRYMEHMFEKLSWKIYDHIKR